MIVEKDSNGNGKYSLRDMLLSVSRDLEIRIREVLDKFFEKLIDEMKSLEESFKRDLDSHDRRVSEKVISDLEKLRKELEDQAETFNKNLSKIIEKEETIKRIFYLITALQTILGGLFLLYKLLQ